MKNTLRNITAIFLVLSVTVGMFAITAFADDVMDKTEQFTETEMTSPVETTELEDLGVDFSLDEDINEQVTVSDEGLEYDAVESESNGVPDAELAANDWWSFNKYNGTLTISKTGNMPNYSTLDGSGTPWHKYESQITNIVIQSGVTSIGNYAFVACNNVTSFTIPNSVTKIGTCAFGKAVIGELHISSKVTSIGSGAFKSVRCNTITVDSGNKYYNSKNNCNAIIQTSTNLLIKGCANTIIPKGVVSIADDAIGTSYNGSSIYLPASVKNIGGYNFYSSSITDIYYGGTPSNKQNITINPSGNNAYYDATWHYNCSGTFGDVSTDDWFYGNAEFVYSRSIMTGMGGTIWFAPYDQLHREQLAVMLYRLSNSPTTTYQSKFPDVPDGTWYSLPIIWAYNNKIISGYESGYFGVGDNITREQLAVMLYRYAVNYKKLKVTQSASLSGYKDASSVSPWALDAIKWAVGNGIITGKDNGTRIDPQGNAARCECAAMFERFMKKYGL